MVRLEVNTRGCTHLGIFTWDTDARAKLGARVWSSEKFAVFNMAAGGEASAHDGSTVRRGSF